MSVKTQNYLTTIGRREGRTSFGLKVGGVILLSGPTGNRSSGSSSFSFRDTTGEGVSGRNPPTCRRYSPFTRRDPGGTVDPVDAQIEPRVVSA